MTRVRMISVLLALAMLVGFGPSRETAQITTTPPGLNPGDQYRLVLATDGRINAASSSIGTYNTFVTDGANLVPELAHLSTSWYAIASTRSGTHARDNTGASPNVSVAVPIYRLAANHVALWDGRQRDLDHAVRRDIGEPNILRPFGLDLDGDGG
jgi:hypothetical protein